MIHLKVGLGKREKPRPDGTSVQTFVTQSTPVCVWSENALEGIAAGDFVVLNGIMIGAVNSTLVFEALGISCANGLVDVLEYDE